MKKKEKKIYAPMRFDPVTQIDNLFKNNKISWKRVDTS